MASKNVHEFTDGNFEAEVLKSNVPVLVDFWAEWCTPCRMLAPTIDQVAGELGDKAKVGKVDIDNNRNLAVEYGITAIPTLLVFKDGKVAKQLMGMQGKDVLVKALSNA
mgnify:CR=1 FL=1